MRVLPKITTLLVLMLCLGNGALAQGQLSPAITVNDGVITQFELDQRKRLLQLFRTPGDLDKIARDGLIEDRLKQQELDRAGLQLSDDALDEALEEFAGRANLSLAQFTQVLAQNNVDPATLRDFVKVGISWRDYIRSRYSREVTITDADVDRALAQQSGSVTAIEVLLSEIIIPAPPPQAARAQAAAERIATFTSFSAFENAAREVSALPSRNNGGRLGWLPITNYPPQLQSVILALRPGQVTAPIGITNGVALFQMRGVREVPQAVAAPASIEYAAYYLPGGQTDAGLRAAAELANQVDTCDDLYGIARNQPPEVLERQSLAPSEIPQDVALELARLDPGEVSYNLTRSNGETRVFLMLCGRTAVGQENRDPEAVRNQLRSERLAGLADALVADLLSSAIIVDR